MSLLTMSFCLTTLVLTSHVLAFKLSDDSEHSGDYDLGINSFTVEQEQQRKIDDDILKLFAQPKQQHPQPPNKNKKKTDLQSDFNDFIELLPSEEIKEKLNEYYRNDMDIQHIYEYVSGKEFYELRKYLLDMHDVKEILQYLSRRGLNVKNLLRKIDHRLGISKMKSPVQQFSAITESPVSNQQLLATNTTVGGICGLLEEILDLLPQDGIFILFFEKLDSSPQFAALAKKHRQSRICTKILRVMEIKRNPMSYCST